ncbi:5571_t:CDS:2, partial [Acaulospora colombiana]
HQFVRILSIEELLAICAITTKEVTPKVIKFAIEEIAIIKEFANS